MPTTRAGAMRRTLGRKAMRRRKEEEEEEDKWVCLEEDRCR